jgi:hypothetical protein
MRIQRLDLFADRLDHMGMTMPNVRHVVIHVQVFVAVGIVEPDTLTAHDMHGLVIEETVCRAEQIAAPLDHCCFVGAHIRFLNQLASLTLPAVLQPW